jgi:hypothetical protein
MVSWPSFSGSVMRAINFSIPSLPTVMHPSSENVAHLAGDVGAGSRKVSLCRSR